MTATVRNVAEPERMWAGRFRVDVAVVDCVVPRRYLEAIGLAVKGERVYPLADGDGVIGWGIRKVWGLIRGINS